MRDALRGQRRCAGSDEKKRCDDTCNRSRVLYADALENAAHDPWSSKAQGKAGHGAAADSAGDGGD